MIDRGIGTLDGTAIVLCQNDHVFGRHYMFTQQWTNKIPPKATAGHWKFC
jgi:hypothetical protein